MVNRREGRWRRRSGRSIRVAVTGAIATAAAVATVTGLAAMPATASTGAAGQTTTAARTASDGPPGFWYGTDSSTIPISGSVPYREPVLGGSYGGYIGMTGNWARWQNCGSKILVWSSANAAQATADFHAHAGVGTGAYWFMAGPGVDPHYNGTTGEAYAWAGSRPSGRWSTRRATT